MSYADASSKRCVEVLEMLETPLLGPEGAKWKAEKPPITKEYDEWIHAQFLSDRAADMVANFKDLLYPLEKTKKQDVLDNVWKFINLVSTLFSHVGSDR